jgi:16S rRNA (cytosine1402-N4)-methyltransferase
MKEIPVHKPVLVQEILGWLQIKREGLYVDLSVGGGGHALAIAERLGPEGRLIAVDIDPAAVERARARLQGYPVTVLLADRREIETHLDKQIEDALVDGWIADLGVSSELLADASRGFSYQSCGPLDMRYDPRQSLTAQQVINTWSQGELERMFRRYAQLKWAGSLARRIAEQRRHQAVTTTAQLADIVAASVPAPARSKLNQALSKVFTAVRIAVNDEIAAVPPMLRHIVARSKSGARICMIGYSSLEDKAVTSTLRELGRKCRCPSSQPVCTCGGPMVRLLTPKAIRPGAREVAENVRARSAMMRCAERT